MTVKIVIEEFNIYNDPALSLDGLETSLGLNMDIPKLQVRFYVHHTYFSETLEGDYQFLRKHRKAFKELKTNFCQKYKAWYDERDELEDEFTHLERVNIVVKDLEEMIQMKFVIPGKIELENIELMGNWPVYETVTKTELVKEFEKGILERMKTAGSIFKDFNI